ncbi:hypothetical protein ACQ4PT_030964 [Festuca glaucescens]
MDIPTELVVGILQRLPWTSRRRLRLVCRFWRDLIHQRTTEMQQPRDAVPLIVTTESAYVVDVDDLDLGEESPWAAATWSAWRWSASATACCACATTPSLAAPSPWPTRPPAKSSHSRRYRLFRRHNSRRSGRSWHQAYSFGYHHGTGQYKVVHVPCFYKTKDTLQVFTLGEASWREVSTPAYARCNLDADVVSANGATYWVTEGSDDRIMSFDLDSEQVTCTQPLPTSARPIRHLTQVNRRLSTATSTHRLQHYYGYVCIQVTLCKSPYLSQIQ